MEECEKIGRMVNEGKTKCTTQTIVLLSYAHCTPDIIFKIVEKLNN